MKLTKLLILPILLLASLVASCGDDQDEPKDQDFFTVALGMEGQPSTNFGKRYGEYYVDGLGTKFIIYIEGDFDSFTISGGIPEWISTSINGNRIYVTVDANSDSSRDGVIGFTAFRDDDSASGYVKVHQEPITTNDLNYLQWRAIDSYMAEKTVAYILPTEGSFRTVEEYGDEAPYYRVVTDEDETMYVQVVSLGSDGNPSEDEKIYFRFIGYNLLDYYYGNEPNAFGNALDMTPAYFNYLSDNESTRQWGQAIQMPLNIGLQLGSKVNIVFPSQLGQTANASYYVPYLYNVTYYKALY